MLHRLGRWPRRAMGILALRWSSQAQSQNHHLQRSRPCCRVRHIVRRCRSQMAPYWHPEYRFHNRSQWSRLLRLRRHRHRRCCLFRHRQCHPTQMHLLGTGRRHQHRRHHRRPGQHCRQARHHRDRLSRLGCSGTRHRRHRHRRRRRRCRRCYRYHRRRGQRTRLDHLGRRLFRR